MYLIYMRLVLSLLFSISVMLVGWSNEACLKSLNVSSYSTLFKGGNINIVDVTQVIAIENDFFSKNSYLLKSDTLEKMECINDVGEMYHPAIYAILKYLGRTYLAYNVSKVYRYLENKATGLVSGHVKKIWGTYEDIERQVGPSNNVAKKAFDNHYHNCKVCKGVADLLTKEEFNTSIRSVELKIAKLNKSTNLQIKRLEEKFSNDLIRMGQRLDGIEQILSSNGMEIANNRRRLQAHDIQIQQNRQGIANNLQGINQNRNDIDDWSMPRILIIQPSRFSSINNELRTLISRCKVHKIGLSIGRKSQVVINNGRMTKLAENIANILNVRTTQYRNTGMNGFDYYDIIIVQ